MKMTTIVLAILLSGCASMTPGQKRALQIGATFLAMGAVMALDDGESPAEPDPIGPGPSCNPQPDGSCR